MWSYKQDEIIHQYFFTAQFPPGCESERQLQAQENSSKYRHPTSSTNFASRMLEAQQDLLKAQAFTHKQTCFFFDFLSFSAPLFAFCSLSTCQAASSSRMSSSCLFKATASW